MTSMVKRYTMTKVMELPPGADLLKVAMVGVDMVLWAQVQVPVPTQREQLDERHFVMLIDGEKVDEDFIIEYLGSAVDGAGQWRHVYEVEAPL